MITARSTPNIALIKYWGNRDERLRLPAADSLSMTLDGPYVDVSVAAAPDFHVTSETLGNEKILSEKDVRRFRNHLELMREHLASMGYDGLETVDIRIVSHIPPGIGLASSAAVFSALAKAIAGHIEKEYPLTDTQISILARLGSGSAARSIYGGYATLENQGAQAVAVQIAPAEHWRLHDIVIVPSHEQKTVGSTEGHAMANTSPHFEERLRDIPTRLRECKAAIAEKDFLKLQAVAETDSMNMHHVMETSVPPLRYLSAETHRLIAEISKLRKEQHLPVLYTMDAGPTVHLFCTDEGLPAVLAFAEAQKHCTMFATKTGSGAMLVQRQ